MNMDMPSVLDATVAYLRQLVKAGAEEGDPIDLTEELIEEIGSAAKDTRLELECKSFCKETSINMLMLNVPQGLIQKSRLYQRT